MNVRLSKILFLILTGTYLSLFLSCGDNSEDDYSLLMKKEKKTHVVTKYLKNKYNTKLVIDSLTTFSNNMQAEILHNKIVVIDSVVKSVKQVGNEYVLNVEVTGDKTKKIYASLKCSEEIKDIYDNINHTNLLIAAHISGIDKILEDYISEEASIDSTVVLKREEIVLYGTCEEIVKKPTIDDFVEEESSS